MSRESKAKERDRRKSKRRRRTEMLHQAKDAWKANAVELDQARHELVTLLEKLAIALDARDEATRTAVANLERSIKAWSELDEAMGKERSARANLDIATARLVDTEQARDALARQVVELKAKVSAFEADDRDLAKLRRRLADRQATIVRLQTELSQAIAKIPPEPLVYPRQEAHGSS